MSFYIFCLLNLSEMISVAVLCHVYKYNLRSTVAKTSSIVSIGGYVASLLLFILYHSPLLNPEVLKQRHRYKYHVTKNYYTRMQCDTLAVPNPWNLKRYRCMIQNLRKATSEILAASHVSDSADYNYGNQFVWSLVPTEPPIFPV